MLILQIAPGLGGGDGPVPWERVCVARRSDGRVIWQVRGLYNGEGPPMRDEIEAKMASQTLGQFLAEYNLPPDVIERQR